MTRKLHISPDLSLPVDAVTQTFASRRQRCSSWRDVEWTSTN